MSRDRITQLIALVVMIAALFGSGGVGLLLNASAGRHKLVYTDTAEKGQPPQVALGIAMGAFRGVFVNFLWIRANNLKEAGKYHEAIELARAITKLQPRFPRVWIFHAWNMAYNISVTTQTKDERWNWVSQGIRLLRDEGIPANPNDTLIHKELAWIFLHKIQGYTDDFNIYYKSQLAAEWQIVLGDPPRADPKNRGRDVVIKQYADWLRGFNEAPNTFAELREKNPAAGELADRVSECLPNRDRFELLRLYEINRALLKSPTRVIIFKQLREKEPLMAKFSDLVADPKNKESWDALTKYLRKRILAQYHMEIPRMIRYTEKFGPLDWRHPAAHGLYWSTRGVEEGMQRYNDANRLDFDFLNTDRIAIQSLQELWRSGDLYFDFLAAMRRQQSVYLAVPNAYFADSYGDYVETLMDRSWADNPTRVFTSYGAGYENFLKDVTRFFFRRGQIDMAERYYERIRKWGRRNTNDPGNVNYLSEPLESFVEKELVDRQISPDVAVQEISASLMDAFQKGLLQDDSEAYRRCVEYAKRFHRYYMEKQLRDLLGGSTARTEKFPRDFYEIAGVLFEKFIDIVPPEEIERVYRGVDEELQRWAYDKIYGMNFEAYKEMEKAGGKSFTATFPEPPGMAEFRMKREKILRDRTSPANGIQTK